MNPDEVKSLLVKMFVMIFTALATSLHMNAGSDLVSQIPAFSADLADLITVGIGVYLHWNMKKVPERAVVSMPPKAQ